MLRNTTTGVPVGKIDGVTLEATNPFPFPAVVVPARVGHDDKEHVMVITAEFAVVWKEPLDLRTFRYVLGIVLGGYCDATNG